MSTNVEDIRADLRNIAAAVEGGEAGLQKRYAFRAVDGQLRSCIEESLRSAISLARHRDGFRHTAGYELKLVTDARYGSLKGWVIQPVGCASELSIPSITIDLDYDAKTNPI